MLPPLPSLATSRAGLRTSPPSEYRESLARRIGRWERRHRTFIRVSGLALVVITLVAIAAALGVNAARHRAEERRRQAITLGEIAEIRKQDADRQRDALTATHKPSDARPRSEPAS